MLPVPANLIEGVQCAVLDAAPAFVDTGAFARDLAELVACRTESQIDPTDLAA